MISEKEVRQMRELQAELGLEERKNARGALNETDRIIAERDLLYYKIRYYTLSAVLGEKPDQYAMEWKEKTEG